MFPTIDTPVPVIRRTISLPVSFESFTQKFESTLNHYDLPALGKAKTGDELKQLIATQIGSTKPFGIFVIRNHGHMLGLVGEQDRKAKQYTIGDPRLALQMTTQDLRAALHAPAHGACLRSGGFCKV